jgi:cbb3-type cytochrome oxidase cytochrome c subunit
MKVREDDRNIVLLATVTLVSVAVAGVVAVLEPATAKQEIATSPAYLADSTPVRVVGAPFVPNTNPRERH